MSPEDPNESGFRRTLSKISKARYFTVSLLAHIGFVILFGGVVLFHSAVELPDFLAGDGDLVDSSDVATSPPPPPPSAVTPTFTVKTPQTAAPDITAITSTAAPTQSFVMNSTPVIAPVKIDTNMDKMMESAAKSIGKATGLGTLPSTMAGRGAGQRGTAMKKHGMKERSEKAVLAGLRWLVKNQNPDGTWGKSYKGGMTGLALLCFLGHGEVPASAEFGPTVAKGIDALVKEGAANNGWVNFRRSPGKNPGVYEQGIAAYALGEAYTLTKDERIEPVLRQAIGLIVDGMAPDSGWNYNYDTTMSRREANNPKYKGESDLSVAGWQIQALKAAHLTGLDIPKVDETLDKSMEFLVRMQGKKGGFGYTLPGDRYSTAGVGVLCQQVWKPKASSVRDGIAFIENGPKVKYDGDYANIYAWYYNTQAMLMKGGSSWTKWNRMFQDEIAEAQNPDGSWPPHGGKKGRGGEQHGGVNEATLDGNLYRTTLCVLMLEVYYRYLPTTK